ncbi:MAG: hypothetical protein WA918_05335 [Erythrobacter sp.]
MVDRTLFSSIFDHRSVFFGTVRADLHFFRETALLIYLAHKNRSLVVRNERELIVARNRALIIEMPAIMTCALSPVSIVVSASFEWYEY